MGYAEKEKAIKVLLGAAPFDLECKEEHMKLYKEAFTHASISNELERGGGKKQVESYERLAYLGDAVIYLVAAEHLYRSPGKLNKGKMTNERQQIVSNECIAKRLKEKNIDLFKLCIHSSGLEENEKNRESITSSIFEALIAAIYINEGYIKAEEIVGRILLK